MTQAGAKGGAKRGLGDMWGLSMMGKPKEAGADGESAAHRGPGDLKRTLAWE